MKKLIALSAAVLAPVLAFAAEHGAEVAEHAAEAAAHGPDYRTFFWRVATFAVFFGVLYKLLKKPLLDFLDTRTKEIEAAISDAKKAKEEAEIELTNYEIKMKEFEKDLATMKDRATKAASAEREEILADAERQIEKLKSFGESLIDAEVTKARVQLRTKAVEEALAEAEKQLGEKLQGDARKKITTEYIKKIGAAQ